MFYYLKYKDFDILFQDESIKITLHLVIFTAFFIIPTMKRENSINHYKNLFNEYPKDSLFLKLQKKLTELLNSLNLENKDIILAIS